MLEEQLKNRMFLNKAGAFSIKKNSRNIVESLKYASEILSNDHHLLLMFPQGEIQSQHITTFSFEKGIETIYKKADKPFHILFTANLIEYYSKRKPSLDVYFKLLDEAFVNTSQLQEAYNTFFAACIVHQKPE